jgi:hypothetical protein
MRLLQQAFYQTMVRQLVPVIKPKLGAERPTRAQQAGTPFLV